MEVHVFNTCKIYSLVSKVFIIHRIRADFSRILSNLSQNSLNILLIEFICKYGDQKFECNAHRRKQDRRKLTSPKRRGNLRRVFTSLRRCQFSMICKQIFREHTTRPIWFFSPPNAYKLTEQDITDFVNCVKEYAFISIFNKSYTEEAAKACHYLSILRPELIVPSIVEKFDILILFFMISLYSDSFCRHFSSIYSMAEPHRFTSIMTCLTHIARQIVQQTPNYSQGQVYVLPLLMSVLPGIDLNDHEKTLVTVEFLDTILMVITCVDCSSAVNSRNDLTEVR